MVLVGLAGFAGIAVMIQLFHDECLEMILQSSGSSLETVNKVEKGGFVWMAESLKHGKRGF